jgi:polyisoprenoid-binding protein YceI
VTTHLRAYWRAAAHDHNGHSANNRKDFGLTWNAALETGGILVGDEVMITFDVEFVKA